MYQVLPIAKRLQNIAISLQLILYIVHLETSGRADLLSQRKTLSIEVAGFRFLDSLVKRGYFHGLPAWNLLHSGQELARAACGGHVCSNIGVPLWALLEHAYVSERRVSLQVYSKVLWITEH